MGGYITFYINGLYMYFLLLGYTWMVWYNTFIYHIYWNGLP